MNPKNYVYAKFIYTSYFLTVFMVFVLGILKVTKNSDDLAAALIIDRIIWVLTSLGLVFLGCYIAIILFLKIKTQYVPKKQDNFYIITVFGLMVLTYWLSLIFAGIALTINEKNIILTLGICFLIAAMIISIGASILETFSRVNEIIFFNRQNQIKKNQDAQKVKKNLPPIIPTNLTEKQITNKKNPFLEGEDVDD
ncbi:hypothetical protein SSABA_v1c05260 [Spiroplasma sabaudiense Ar-1343]|uniref:Transmembrane protein n=1 Tax=Spiroplasma sabaudiense Ar-1343 TaxID=1276257 RepID=W6A9T1_9MOLU|nr:hypothetical protein [Spiroplasma sabaudiense]AHI53933.1 hypothetical protein SSABA_v1c05260 [Spiroplasma sabaudiense Ar-1343]